MPDEVKVLMLLDEKVRALIGLYEAERRKADKYRSALLAIRDASVNVAAIAEEALSCDR